MVRLTPVFAGGATTTQVDVRNPAFSSDGQRVFFDYGEFAGGSWYVAPWSVGADGSAVPELFQTNLSCSINGFASFNPVTGDLLLKHSVCVPGTPSGYYLYPKAGGAPVQLIDGDSFDLSERAVFSHAGESFLFTAKPSPGKESSLYLYVLASQKVQTLVNGENGYDVVNVALSPDNLQFVYCTSNGDSKDLWLLDLSVEPFVHERLTQDGMSCSPVF